MKKSFLLLLHTICCITLMAQNGEAWSLKDCIDYALEHNIQIQKGNVSEQEGAVNLWMNRGALLPSLRLNVSQGLGYRPFEETTAIVQNGQVTNTSSKVTYQGSYGVNASWTVWDGGINYKNIQAQKLQNEITALNTEQSEMSIQEQITQLYVQILYTQEAIKVNEQLQETALKQYERGQEMEQQGLMAKVDVAQLEAQWSGAKYDVINSQTQLSNYKRQLKALLELGIDTPFQVSTQAPNDQAVMEPVMDAQLAYEKALLSRPEVKSAELSIEAANINLDIAKRGYMPTISMSASVGDSHYSASNKNAGQQMKTNLNMSAGVTLSMPIFDNRRNAGNVKLAKLKKASTQMDLQDTKNTLGSTIEQYWLNAINNQKNYMAAKDRVKSQQASYQLINEKFQHGLENVVNLLQGRDNLIQAEQNLLQSKYMTLLNIQLLKFYTGEEIEL